MNIINILNPDTNLSMMYTEHEVLNLVAENKRVKQIREDRDEARDKVYNFFRNLEWSSGEATVNRVAVNELLNSICAHTLTASYSATATITVTISGYDAESEDDANYNIADSISVDIDNGDITIEDVQVDSIEEEE